MPALLLLFFQKPRCPMQARQPQSPSLPSSETNSCPVPMMFQCNKAVSAVGGKRTSAAESTASTSSSLSSPEVPPEGSWRSPARFLVWHSPTRLLGPFSFNCKRHALARRARPRVDQHSLRRLVQSVSARVAYAPLTRGFAFV
jgi:hypothetical protein